jgi:methylphosphotriester-DNA--protein-cysteine methyltransferase
MKKAAESAGLPPRCEPRRAAPRDHASVMRQLQNVYKRRQNQGLRRRLTSYSFFSSTTLSSARKRTRDATYLQFAIDVVGALDIAF